jgi:hypothetical protein
MAEIDSTAEFGGAINNRLTHNLRANFISIRYGAPAYR